LELLLYRLQLARSMAANEAVTSEEKGVMARILVTF